DSEPAREWSPDRFVSDQRLLLGDLRLVALECCKVGIGGLLTDRVGLQQAGIAIVVKLRERLGRLEGIQMRDIVGGFELDKQRSLLDLIAGPEVDRLDNAGDLRTEVRTFFRPGAADGLAPLLPRLRRGGDGGHGLRRVPQARYRFLDHPGFEGFKAENRRQGGADKDQHDGHASVHPAIPSPGQVVERTSDNAWACLRSQISRGIVPRKARWALGNRQGNGVILLAHPGNARDQPSLANELAAGPWRSPWASDGVPQKADRSVATWTDMNSFELNKVIGAVLASCLVLLSVSLISDSIFAPVRPAKPGFKIEAKQETASTAPAAKTETAAPIETRLASADASKGKPETRVCMTCHTLDKNGPNKVGPNLYGVVDRPRASHPGFDYSSAMKA